MSKISEMVSIKNELEANSERDDDFQLCGAGLFIAQLVPVTPDAECLVLHQCWCWVFVRSVVPGNAIQGQLQHVFSMSSLTHQGISDSIRSLWFPQQAD